MILKLDIAAFILSLLIRFAPFVSGHAGKYEESKMDNPCDIKLAKINTLSLLFDRVQPSQNTYRIKAKNTFAAISIFPKV